MRTTATGEWVIEPGDLVVAGKDGQFTIVLSDKGTINIIADHKIVVRPEASNAVILEISKD